MSLRLGPLPIWLQVVCLVLASVLAAQAITFGIMVLAPPPEPPGLSVPQVAAALEGRTPSGSNLSRTVVDQPPIPATPARDMPGHVIAMSLAETLRLPASAVRVSMIDAGPALFRARQNVEAPGSSASVFVMQAPIARPKGEAAIRDPSNVTLSGIFGTSIRFRPFVTAVDTGRGWVVVKPRLPLISPWQVRLLLCFFLSTLLLAPLTWWSARRLTRQIRFFAEAAEKLGIDPSAPPLPAHGPPELRAAVTSFNRMQQRLRTYVERRTAMVAAIAHDFRTPLTSLRLRAESSPEPARQRMIADLERMEVMIAQVLAFVRGEQVREARVRTALNEVVASCTQEAAERGGVVGFIRGPEVSVLAEPLNLHRALTNVIDNALKYGEAATVSVRVAGQQALVEVEDRGPGLPEAELERVFEPFHRLEPSRNRATGGVGLGLALARTVIEAHGGKISLHNRPAGGLIARISLPLDSGAEGEVPTASPARALEQNQYDSDTRRSERAL